MGMSGRDFYEYNIEKMFKLHSMTTEENLLGRLEFKWNFINDNNYAAYTLIVLGGYGLGAHYFLIIGVDTTKTYYLITDQSEKVWVANKKLMRTACLYALNGYSQHSLYKVGKI